jgi:hypothetical protein
MSQFGNSPQDFWPWASSTNAELADLSHFSAARSLEAEKKHLSRRAAEPQGETSSRVGLSDVL